VAGAVGDRHDELEVALHPFLESILFMSQSEISAEIL
jgi:hypothetical protein